MKLQARGTFEVQATPMTPYDDAPGATIGRTIFTKQFSGEFEGTSVVEMTSAVTEVEGSAAYVAIERINGVLNGRKGTFVALHTGLMNRGESSLTITIVPDSGTGELKSITGSMDIQIEDGKHFYTVDYSLE